MYNVSMGIPHETNCSHCGAIIQLSKGARSRYKKGQRNFYCNRSCYTSSKLGTTCSAETKLKISESHKGVNHPFYKKKQSKESNRKRSESGSGNKNPRWIEDAPVVRCSHCGKEKRIMPSQYKVCKTKVFYCDSNCRAKHWEQLMAGENNPNWLGGVSFEPYAPAFNEKLKKKIRARDNNVCQLCGSSKSKVRNGNTMIVHHIDYDKSHNNENNLIALCNKCNSKVNFNRDYWVSYFSNLLKIERRDDYVHCQSGISRKN